MLCGCLQLLTHVSLSYPWIVYVFRSKRTHGDCVWYTVGATVLMALVEQVVKGIVIVVVDVVGEFWAVSVLR